MGGNIKKKDFLIVFLYPHLAYSPSTLNLFYSLRAEGQNVKILADRQPNSHVNEISDPDITYIDLYAKRPFINIMKMAWYILVDIFLRVTTKNYDQKRLHNFKTLNVVSYLRKTKKQIIAVDSTALWCAKKAGKKAHLLSLELAEEDEYYKNIKIENILSVIIQSHERLNYLFPQQKPKYFIVQNSPRSIDYVPEYLNRKKTDLIFCGTPLSAFGIFTCLDFIKDYEEYTLTIRGAVPEDIKKVIDQYYADLLNNNRLVINKTYLSEAELTSFISNFRIGFAFYDVYRFQSTNRFNYITAPSGKVFQYLNSGVPIIGNDLPAFQFIEQTNAGKLIPHLSSIQIKIAIDKIENDYLTHAKNAKKVSYEYDFDKMVKPFLDYINT